GWCCKRTGQLEEAIESLEQALQRHPDDALVNYNLACYYSLEGRGLDALRLEPTSRASADQRRGRAGREGKAILFVAQREKRMLHTIERATGKKIQPMELPTAEVVNRKRLEKLQTVIETASQSKKLDIYRQMVGQLQQEIDTPVEDIAAILLMINRDYSIVTHKEPSPGKFDESDDRKNSRKKRRDSAVDGERKGRRPQQKPLVDDKDMDRYRIAVGHDDKVTPGNIVGCIANEAEIDSEYIGRIQIFDDHSLVDLPKGMPKETYKHLKKSWVCGKRLDISRLGDQSDETKTERSPGSDRRRPDKSRSDRPGKKGGKPSSASNAKTPRKRPPSR
ncbi:MAG: DbpA RNA binding domain-containing protein, partial [bacterium]